MRRSERGEVTASQGFTLLELMIAMVVTLVITGAMYGLMAQGQTSFRREPALMDRQQQIRIAMDRIQEDVMGAGMGMGPYFQSFGTGLGAVGVAGATGLAVTGVRASGDTSSVSLGGGNPDALEIRSLTADCPLARATFTAGRTFTTTTFPGTTYPPCFLTPSYVVAIFPSGAAKMAFLPNDGARESLVFNANTTAMGSQFDSDANAHCDVYLTGAATCPVAIPPGLPNLADPQIFAKIDRILYRLGLDTDGEPSLFRSATAGYDGTTFNTAPPGAAWQLVARGIEDMQIEYRNAAGFQPTAPVVPQPTAAGAPQPSLDNVVRELQITLWARTPILERNLQGQTVAVGNGATAVRGQMITSVAPRAAQVALMNETDVLKRWQ